MTGKKPLTSYYENGSDTCMAAMAGTRLAAMQEVVGDRLRLPADHVAASDDSCAALRRELDERRRRCGDDDFTDNHACIERADGTRQSVRCIHADRRRVDDHVR